MSSKKSLVLRVYRTEEELAVLKTLSLCYNFQNIDDYLHFVIERGVAKDIEDFNKWSAEQNVNLATAVAAGLIAGDEQAKDFYSKVEEPGLKTLIDEARVALETQPKLEVVADTTTGSNADGTDVQTVSSSIESPSV